MLRPWPLQIQLNNTNNKAIYLQIADAIIEAIQLGQLKEEEALPGSRKLAEIIGVNRNTVIEAYDVLLSEGWIESKSRSGTYVSKLSGKETIKKKSKEVIEENKNQINYTIMVDDGNPDTSIAPVEELARAYRQIFKRKGKWQMMGYSSPLGLYEFREHISKMLNHLRGMQVTAEEICISRGSQMAMYLVAQVLLKPNDYVIVEHPGYKKAWNTFEHAGAQLLYADVDSQGININQVEDYLKKYKNIKAIYLTPHHQYPTTATLSLQRRYKLIELSNQYNFSIIEDDYDYEFHYGHRPIMPISSLPNIANYVYIGTLSKVVAPSLRIGYIATDSQLIAKIGELRSIIDVQGDNIMEQAVLQLMEDGTIRKHLKKAHNYYKDKRDLTANLLDIHLKDIVEHTIADGGLAIWLVPLKKIKWSTLEAQLQKERIKIMGPSRFSYLPELQGIRFSFGSLTTQQIEESILILKKYL
ncbi:PLP-dependent aminotransferase family protein [Myroides sp. M-43]|uniref:MocR-like pyridoxine biosynthesis transcription factor PdxR n=1 Tax=Myroides oncorhynchi TaxID=2893756 RepID=UPI001E3FCF7F|nr:PLP-dependent aminotransferase family protein [Myroides oncorhynchi]MCC9043761.1 PLP-dependent aminotransferase family protein [Myroides oncorhynchi]